MNAATETQTPLCFGAEDVDGSPMCDGPDRRPVYVVERDGVRCAGHYCAYCYAEAKALEDAGELRVEDRSDDGTA